MKWSIVLFLSFVLLMAFLDDVKASRSRSSRTTSRSRPPSSRSRRSPPSRSPGTSRRLISRRFTGNGSPGLDIGIPRVNIPGVGRNDDNGYRDDNGYDGRRDDKRSTGAAYTPLYTIVLTAASFKFWLL